MFDDDEMPELECLTIKPTERDELCSIAESTPVLYQTKDWLLKWFVDIGLLKSSNIPK